VRPIILCGKEKKIGTQFPKAIIKGVDQRRLGNSAMTTREFLTTKEVAEYLRVNQYTVYRLVAQKKLPAFKVGSQWRFKRSVLNHWLRKQLNASTH
jgi:excisionase family DNA binding protein